ncbi:hypothetical protein NMY22_g14280 [Coprinellus aureogranulatus]|nr:hypothetical protein NMY22_g14280 [Coprinellus aureogranulatus]
MPGLRDGIVRGREFDIDVFRRPQWYTKAHGYFGFMPLNPDLHTPPFESLTRIPFPIYDRNANLNIPNRDIYSGWKALQRNLVQSCKLLLHNSRAPTIRTVYPCARVDSLIKPTKGVLKQETFKAGQWFEVWMGCLSYAVATCDWPSMSPQMIARDSSASILGHKFSPHTAQDPIPNKQPTQTTFLSDAQQGRRGYTLSKPRAPKKRREWDENMVAFAVEKHCEQEPTAKRSKRTHVTVPTAPIAPNPRQPLAPLPTTNQSEFGGGSAGYTAYGWERVYVHNPLYTHCSTEFWETAPLASSAHTSLDATDEWEGQSQDVWVHSSTQPSTAVKDMLPTPTSNLTEADAIAVLLSLRTAQPDLASNANLTVLTGQIEHESPPMIHPVDTPEPVEIPRTYQKAADKAAAKLAKIKEAARLLVDAGIPPTEFLLTILDDEQSCFEPLRTKFFDKKNHHRILTVLEKVKTNKQTKDMFDEWMHPIAVDYVIETVDEEIERAKPALLMYTNEITPKYAQEWDVEKIMEPVLNSSPIWTKILGRATTPRTVDPEDDEDSIRQRQISRLVITSQVLHTRSRNCIRVALGIGMTASALGASRQVIGLFHQAGASVSYQTLQTATDVLGAESIDTAKVIAAGPHAACYDNFQTSTSIFVEQTLDTRSKVQSGTVSLIYELHNAKHEDLLISTLREHEEKNARPLKMHDLRPSAEQSSAYAHQSSVNIVNVLLANVDAFSAYIGNPLLKHKVRRALPEGHKTKFAPLRASTIEEASAQGNFLVHDDIYQVQLEMDPVTLETYAILTLNDQMTNSRIRTCQRIRKNEFTEFDRRSGFKIGLALFHMCLNAAWAVKTIHWGTIKEDGCLSSLFCILDKKRLAGAKPDYHSLESALSQVLDGLLLNAWERECGFASLEAYTASKPTAQDLLNLAARIKKKYATPNEKFTPAQKDKDAPADEPEIDDPVYENIVRLIRDLLLIKEVVSAIKDGDIGRVEDILVDFAFLFRGAGSHNYCHEILHLLRNLKLVWTPELANIMRDNMIVNISGIPGRAMGIDLNIEHIIRYLKTIFASKGISGRWEHSANISAAINNIMALKRQVTRTLKLPYQGSTHTPADTRALVLRMASKAKELRLLEVVPGRTAVLRPDLRALGYQKLESSGLATFNKKLEGGSLSECLEIDEIEPVGFAEVEVDLDNFEFSG